VHQNGDKGIGKKIVVAGRFHPPRVPFEIREDRKSRGPEKRARKDCSEGREDREIFQGRIGHE